MCFLWWRYILVKNVFPIGDKGYCLGRKFFFQKAAMVIFSSNNVRKKNEELQESSSFYFDVEEINHELLDPEEVNPRLYSLRDSMENSIRSPLFPLRFLMDGGTWERLPFTLIYWCNPYFLSSTIRHCCKCWEFSSKQGRNLPTVGNLGKYPVFPIKNSAVRTFCTSSEPIEKFVQSFSMIDY